MAYAAYYTPGLKYQVAYNLILELPRRLKVPTMKGSFLHCPEDVVREFGVMKNEVFLHTGASKFRVGDYLTVTTGETGYTDRIILKIGEGFAYDGASYAIDTKAAQAAALVHDALYMILRNTPLLDEKKWPEEHALWRQYADALYYRIARANGMWWTRARLHYRALRKYGRTNTLRKNRREIKEHRFEIP